MALLTPAAVAVIDADAATVAAGPVLRKLSPAAIWRCQIGLEFSQSGGIGGGLHQGGEEVARE